MRIALLAIVLAAAGGLSGASSGPARAGPRSSGGLTLITEPNAGIAPIDAVFAGARTSVDLELYELADPHLEAILAADAARGVLVRVLLDRIEESSHNAPAIAYLSAHGVAVRFASNRYVDLTHEKAAVIDGRRALVMTLNLVANDYRDTRDFAVLDTKRADVAAIAAVFAADWAGTAVRPSDADDLVWSPGAEAQLVSVIAGARHHLLVENEEMEDPYITAPLEAAARRGVHVEVVMTAAPGVAAALRALTRAGVAVRTYSESAPRYIHAKAIVADPGSVDARAFVGSQNFSITSLVYNRELGIITTSRPIVTALARTITGDFAAAGA